MFIRWYSAQQQKQRTDSHNVDEARTHNTEQKKPDAEEYMREASIYMKFKEKATLRDGDQSQQSNYLRGILTGKSRGYVLGSWKHSMA